jgi:alkylation response protein AidB-like acyl-CoA dehydrogenase
MNDNRHMVRAENTVEGQRALRQALVAKAAALVPLLRANAEKAEQARRLPEENLAALDEAQLFRLRTPKRFGGLETDIRTYTDVVTEIGRGCGSTAWIAFISNATVWVACHFPDAALQEVFDGNPDARFIGLLAPLSTAKPRDGGWMVSGKWPFASGCLHAHWALFAVPLPRADGTIEPSIVMMPMSDMTIEDTWYFAAMRGTGSNTVVANDVFVPAHRAMPLSHFLAANGIGNDPEAAVYREAFSADAIIMLAAPILGLARAALELTLERINTGGKRISYSVYDDLRKAPSMQLQLAEAASLVERSTMIVRQWCDDISEAARSGEALPFLKRAQMRVDLGHAMSGCRDAVDKLLNVQGASAFADANPLQRIWRDIEFGTRHGLLSPEVPLEIFGRALVGDFEMLSPLV